MTDPHTHEGRAAPDLATGAAAADEPRHDTLACLPTPPLAAELDRRARARGLLFFTRAHEGGVRVLTLTIAEAATTSALAGLAAVYLAWAIEAASRVLPP